MIRIKYGYHLIYTSQSLKKIDALRLFILEA